MTAQQEHNTCEGNHTVADLAREVVALRRDMDALKARRPGWVTTTKAAELLGVAHRSTVIDWINAGRLDAYRLEDGAPWRVQLASIDALLAAQPTT